MPWRDELSTPEGLLESGDDRRTYTLSHTEKVLSIVSVVLVFAVFVLSWLVFDVKTSVTELRDGIESNGKAGLVNRETGYKNRAVACAIYRNMVNRPAPLEICDDPNVTKYLGTDK